MKYCLFYILAQRCKQNGACKPFRLMPPNGRGRSSQKLGMRSCGCRSLSEEGFNFGLCSMPCANGLVPLPNAMGIFKCEFPTFHVLHLHLSGLLNSRHSMSCANHQTEYINDGLGLGQNGLCQVPQAVLPGQLACVWLGSRYVLPYLPPYPSHRFLANPTYFYPLKASGITEGWSELIRQ